MPDSDPSAGPAGLPTRTGPRPRIAPDAPHLQLDQPAQPAARQRAMERGLARLAGVVTGPGTRGAPGTLGLFLAPKLAGGPAEAFLAETEFAQFHPLPQGSLQLTLPPPWHAAAIAQGWAEAHPLAGQPGTSPLTVLVYAPRDAAEADVVARLVGAAWAFARGEAR